jgi:hypothetical protein
MTTATSLGTFLVASLLGLLGQAPRFVTVSTVRLRVFAHAAVDAPDLELGRATASTLLESTRIGVEWRTCGTVEDTCSQPAEPVSVIVLLMPVSKMTRDDVSAEVVRNGPAHASTILVYLPNLSDRVRTVRGSPAGRSHPALASLQLGHLVGLAIAHEVGHLFGLPHSRSGVMKARLATDDLLAMRESRLGFSAKDVSVLRQAVVARTLQDAGGGR